MKLLLTSGGITTQAIADSLLQLAGDNKKIGFIPTAANAESGNKDWYIDQITHLQKYGFDWIDFIDPSAPGVDWKSRLSEVGIVFVSGGNTFHLLDQTRRTGFGAWLGERLETIVYVGASAGSILATPNIETSDDENLCGITDLAGLNYVHFELIPHVAETGLTIEQEHHAASINNTLYALNDQSAICVVDGRVTIINEGPFIERH